jgi:rubrerythrin
MAEIQSVLRPLEQFETLMQEIYALLAERFGADADAAALFRRLAFEERSHAGQVRFLRRLARQNPSHFTEVDVDLGAIQRELQQLERVHGAAGQLTLREAVVLAIEFENGVAEVHSRPAIAGSNPEVGSMLRSLQSVDLKHFTSLVEFAQKRGFRTG